MIRIENLRFRTLGIDSLDLAPGITSIIGLNGSGKTTFLKLCAGILVPEAGSIRIDGTEPRLTDIGWVNEFPDRNFLFERVSDEISSTLRFRHLPGDEIARRTRDILHRFDLAHLSDRSVRELSGGEKVFVALAAAMVQNPRVLILDECDSHLDIRCFRRINKIVGESEIPYIIRSTQDMDNAALSDHIVLLENGRVRCSGNPASVIPALEHTPFYPLSWMCRV
jgi:energy-coupling factor transport system ATP-binding protein